MLYFNSKQYEANRLSSTIGGNREMDQLYTTSQVPNITRKAKFSHMFLTRLNEECKTENKEQI